MLPSLVIVFMILSSFFASLSFLSFIEKESTRTTWSLVALLRHIAISIILMLLCSTACRQYQRYTGFFVGLCFAFFLLKSTWQILRNERHVLSLEKGHFFLILFFAVVSCAAAFILCTFTAYTEFVLLSVLLSPFYSIISLKLHRLIDTFGAKQDASQAKRIRKQAKNLISIAVAGNFEQEDCIHFLSGLIQKEKIILKDASYDSLSRSICTTLDSTVRFLIFALPEDSKEAKKMLRLADPRCVVLCDVDKDSASAHLACRYVKNGGAVVLSADKKDVFSKDVRSDVIIRTYFGDRYEPSDIVFYKIQTTQSGTFFTAKETSTQHKTDGLLRLIGSRSVRAAAAAVTCSRFFGLNLEQAVQQLASIEPIYRKLSMFPIAQGAVWIDDAQSASQIPYAFETLDAFSGRKIGVLGSYVQLEQNKQLGHLASKHLDIAVLCGDGADAVQCGLIEAGFAQDCIFYVQSAAHLRRLTHQLVQTGDVILQILTQFNFTEVF